MEGHVLTLDGLAEVLKAHRTAGRRVVLCHGCFDPLHVGHIRHFRQASAHGDVLAVTVTPDRFVDKGPGRPVFEEALRAEAVASLRVVDLVAVNDWPTAEDTIRLLRPDVYSKGAEFRGDGADPTGKMDLEKRVVEEIGAELVFTDGFVFSSTRTLPTLLSDLADTARRCGSGSGPAGPGAG